LAQAQRLARQPARSIRSTKELLKRQHMEPLRQMMRDEGELFMSMLLGPEAMEAMQAFMEKRKPDFSRFS
jgi:enoyl-CoA hydratase/carnithine racemase